MDILKELLIEKDIIFIFIHQKSSKQQKTQTHE